MKSIEELKNKIEINIFNLKVSKHGYYSFNYSAVINGKKKKGSCDSSYSGQTARFMWCWSEWYKKIKWDNQLTK